MRSRPTPGRLHSTATFEMVEASGTKTLSEENAGETESILQSSTDGRDVAKPTVNSCRRNVFGIGSAALRSLGHSLHDMVRFTNKFTS